LAIVYKFESVFTIINLLIFNEIISKKF
jgi:hypothetical protein